MKLNAVSILFFDCVSKKTDLDFSESVVLAVYWYEGSGAGDCQTVRQQLSFTFTESCFQPLLGHLGD